MSVLTDRPEWQALLQHRSALGEVSTPALFAADPQRFADMSLEWEGMLYDWSKQPVTKGTMALLQALATATDLKGGIAAMFEGQRINSTEGRAVLHTALRAPRDASVTVDGRNVVPDVWAELDRFTGFADAVRSGAWTAADGGRIEAVVNIGIGGSDLGPAMAVQALAPFVTKDIAFHFASNVDGAHLDGILQGLDPRRTLFIVASKTFTTAETLLNAHSARAWFLEKSGLGEAAIARHFAAVSTNLPAVGAFGISAEATFGFWDWVGGRYSLWSAIGLSIAIALGGQGFHDMLAGARAMDSHFRNAPLDRNMPVTMALVGIWNRSICGVPALAVLPYDQRLARFPAYLQQLEMESNGKQVTQDGTAVGVDTCPVVMGEPGTNGQHAFYQQIHQGPQPIACDILMAAVPDNALASHQPMLLANALAQQEALMRGRDTADALAEELAGGRSGAEAERLARHRTFPGSRPVSGLLYDRLTPFRLGTLIALYEHKVFVQGWIWGLNSFDQWGVELGKVLAKRLQPLLEDKAADRSALDASTAGQIAFLQRMAV